MERDDDLVDQMMMRDTVGYLPDDILVKLDRATMSVSLEGRIPLLDHRVVELLASMPPRMKVRDGETKYLLRRVLDRYVPPNADAQPEVGLRHPCRRIGCAVPCATGPRTSYHPRASCATGTFARHRFARCGMHI